jgi:hypothetical protein
MGSLLANLDELLSPTEILRKMQRNPTPRGRKQSMRWPRLCVAKITLDSGAATPARAAAGSTNCKPNG